MAAGLPTRRADPSQSKKAKRPAGTGRGVRWFAIKPGNITTRGSAHDGKPGQA